MNKRTGLSLIMLGSIVALPTHLYAGDIHTAVRRKDFNAVKDIVLKAQNISKQDKEDLVTSVIELFKITPLMIACETNQLEIAQFLLEHGARRNINLMDISKNTALSLACKVGNEVLVSLLLQHGAQKSINLVSDEGETTLYWAIKWLNKKMVALLEPYLSLEIINRQYKPNNKTILHMVCAQNNYIASIIKKILTKCTDDTVNRCDATGKTPLLLACEYNNFDMVQFLFGLNEKYELENDVIADKSIHILDDQARTLLWWAVKNNNLKLIKSIKSFADDLVSYGILENGIEGQINIPDINGHTPLHCAIRNRSKLGRIKQESKKKKAMAKNQAIIKFLLEHGAGKLINMSSENDETLLAHACKEKDTDMALLLLEQGAIESINRSGEIEKGMATPLFYVCTTNNQIVFDYLFKYCKKEIINLFNKYEKTALCFVCMYDNERMFKALLAQSCIHVLSRHDNDYPSRARPLYQACVNSCITNNMQYIISLILNGARVTFEMMERVQKEGEAYALLQATEGYDACIAEEEKLDYIRNVEKSNWSVLQLHFLVKLCFARSLEQVIKKIEPCSMSNRNTEKIETLLQESEFGKLYKYFSHFGMSEIFGISQEKLLSNFARLVVQKNDCYLALKQYFTPLFNQRLLEGNYDVLVVCQEE